MSCCSSEELSIFFYDSSYVCAQKKRSAEEWPRGSGRCVRAAAPPAHPGPTVPAARRGSAGCLGSHRAHHMLETLKAKTRKKRK